MLNIQKNKIQFLIKNMAPHTKPPAVPSVSVKVKNYLKSQFGVLGAWQQHEVFNTFLESLAANWKVEIAEVGIENYTFISKVIAVCFF